MTSMTSILVYLIAILLARVYALEKRLKSVACHDIETPNGFEFQLECLRAMQKDLKSPLEIAVYRNKLKIAIFEPGKKKNHLPEVMSIDDNSIVTKDCNDIQINCLIDGEPVRESWLYYKTEKTRTKRWLSTSEDRNISCLNITTQGGFKFPHECPVGHEMTVYRDKTTNAYQQIVTATGVSGKSMNYSSEVKSIDEHSITMTQCTDIQIYCFLEDDQHENESWLNYKTGAYDICTICTSLSPPHIGDTDWPKAWTISLSVACMIMIITGLGFMLGFMFMYCSWKRKITREQQGAATVSGFIRHLWGRVSIGIRSRETRSHDEERGVQDEDEISMERIQPQPNGPPAVEDTSIDSEPDGLMPHAHCLDLSEERIQKAHSTPPERASHNRAINRNLRDDPGGVNDIKDKDDGRTEEINSGCLPRDGVSATHETEEQPLLSAQRVNVRESGVTGETAPLLNNDGGGNDQDLDGERAELDTDVESMLKLKNCSTYCSA